MFTVLLLGLLSVPWWTGHASTATSAAYSGDRWRQRRSAFPGSFEITLPVMHRSRIFPPLPMASAGLLFLLVGLDGCGLSRSSPEGEATIDTVSVDGPDFRNAEVTIMVRNQHWLDLNIYLVRGTSSERLATAGGLSTKVITLPWRRVGGAGTLRLGADPIGQDRGIVSEMIQVRPSSVVEWTIGSDLRNSYVSVF